ncbi:hypothetical protein DFH28DRAFT_879452, partial [Melampsora americana]
NAKAHNFPNRYIKILCKFDTHSDDELNVKQGIHIVKTLMYQSEAARIFMQGLDEHMKHSDTLSQSQQRMIADCYHVMFPMDPSVSLLGISHLDEKLCDQKFTDQHWARATKANDLDHLNLGQVYLSDGSKSDYKGNGSDVGTVIDLDNTDDEDENDEDKEKDKEQDKEGEQEDEEGMQEDQEGSDKGKGKGKEVLENWAESKEFKRCIGGEKGNYYVQDDVMITCMQGRIFWKMLDGLFISL